MLGANIALSQLFRSIGWASAYFNGGFDGKGFTISNLDNNKYINKNNNFKIGHKILGAFQQYIFILYYMSLICFWYNCRQNKIKKVDLLKILWYY